jgi:hypothetical protein
MTNVGLVRLLTLSWGKGLHASDDPESCISCAGELEGEKPD